MSLPIISDVIREIGNIIDDVVTTDEEILKIQLQERAIAAALMQSQMAINQEEAKHKSVFVAGWRPWIGWGCGTAIWMYYVVMPFTEHTAWLFGYIAARPTMNVSDMLGLTATLLGSAWLRNKDKLQGTDTKGIV